MDQSAVDQLTNYFAALCTDYLCDFSAKCQCNECVCLRTHPKDCYTKLGCRTLESQSYFIDHGGKQSNEDG